ncbi:hypothetical protein E1B25_21410 [Antarcticimicrobium sediminis]|uniref:Uncharacterized protein n=1 Tax=Antarcticimicrobium sediminis TaxID=2546227 RepID=A0A4R5EG97_9RHOB|nr:hypothetical protein E1B25_21410 [Antarcticimicrobium sediminis]
MNRWARSSTQKAEKVLTVHRPTYGVIGRSVLTQGNLNNNHFYLREFIGAFPSGVIGGGNRASAAPCTLTINWTGSGTVTTDIDGSKKSSVIGLGSGPFSKGILRAPVMLLKSFDLPPAKSLTMM